MLLIAKLALYSWIPFVLLVFAVMAPRRAVIFAYIGGWLFLPMLSIKLNGIPDLTKITAASFGIMLSVALFDAKTVLRFRPGWFDLPMILWCLSPFVTSVKNELGWYDGLSNVVNQLAIWGVPYFVGRIYFKDLEAFKELGIGIVIGAIVYIPFTWLEMKTSPLLHKWLFGFAQHDLSQTKRWGGYRPMVFMQSGLALAMYMMTASVVITWMWLSGTLKKIWGMPIFALVVVLFVTAIMCKTMAAIAFLFIAGAALLWIKWFKNGLPLLMLLAVPPTYMYLRATEVVDREHITNVMSKFTTADRLESLDVRLKAEDLVTDRAFQAPDPWFGWGKWDPNNPRETPWRIYEHYEKVSQDGITYTVVKDVAPTDGLWIITLGQFGKMGVILLTVTILLPSMILWRRIPLRFWAHPLVAPIAAMSVLLILHMVDNLLNGMINPIFVLALGGTSAVVPTVRTLMKRYGAPAVQSALDQMHGSTAGTPLGAFPVVMPAGRPMSAYPVAAPAAFPAMPGFPVISGLQAGSVSFPQAGPSGARRRP